MIIIGGGIAGCVAGSHANEEGGKEKAAAVGHTALTAVDNEVVRG
ncbi:MAG: hypothetical protein ACKOYM_09845 [Actinomycetes bacterium]